MAAQKGDEFLLKIGDGGGPETFTKIGGFRTNNLSINNALIDITNKDSAEMQELLAGAGIQSLSASGSGVFTDDAAFATANTACLNKTKDNWQLIIPDFGTYTCGFMVESLEFDGTHDGEQTFSISLKSSGAITFAAI